MSRANTEHLRQAFRRGQNGPIQAPTQYGDFGQYISWIYVPAQITVGAEVVEQDIPTVVIRRQRPLLREIFAKPFFSIARKIRVRFHWEGIQVLGANMESPNCFVFPVPLTGQAGWYLKVSCLSGCAPGLKPLYVSIETLRKNLLLTGISILAKLLAAISLCAVIALPFLYFTSDAVHMYINNAVLGSGNASDISFAALVLFSVVIFSKRFDEIFSSLQEDNSPHFVDGRGGKLVSTGITVRKRQTRHR